MRLTRTAISLFGLLAVVTSLRGQNPSTKLGVDVRSVTVDVSVFSLGGRPITTLDAAAFSVYEDGQLQKITSVEIEDSPHSILLLLDLSAGSPFLNLLQPNVPARVWREGDPMTFAANETVSAVTRILRPQDRFSVVLFDREVKVASDWRGVGPDESPSIRLPEFRVRSEMSPTRSVYASLEDAVGRFRKEKGKKAVLALTNGHDLEIMAQFLKFGAPLPLPEDRIFLSHLRNIEDAHVPLYIGMTGFDMPLHRAWFWNGDEEAMTAFKAGARLRLGKLAETTGGRITFPKTLSDLTTLLDRIAVDMGGSYHVTYTSDRTKQGNHHQIEVRVRDTGRVIQSRTEYDSQ